MKTARYSPAALSDLDRISDWIAKTNPTRATSFRDELMAKAVEAGQRPRSFPLRSEIGADIRAIRHGNYLLYFREFPNEVRILRILHTARDQPTAFKAPPTD